MQIIYRELSYNVTGLLFKVHNTLGRYAREKQYGDVFDEMLKQENLHYSREHKIGTLGNIADFIIDNKMVIELKAKPILTKDDYYQTQRYLLTTGYKLGLLVNFRNRYLKPVRVIRSDKKQVDSAYSLHSHNS